MLIQLVIIQIITFIGLIFLLRFLFSRNLNSALNSLKALHEENLVKESQLTEELRRAKEERDAEIKRGKEQASLLIEEAKKEAINLSFKIEEGAKITAEKIISQGKEEVNRFKEKAKKDLQGESLNYAVWLIGHFFTEENKGALQIQFINEIIKEVAEVPKEKFSVSTSNIKVISSCPLQEQQRENLQKVLSEKLGGIPKLEEVVNRELIVGLILEMGGLIIDGTLKNRLRKFVTEI